MKDILGLLNDLRRPRLLIRTARIGVQDYRREVQLGRILGITALPRPGQAVMKLMELEMDIDERRRQDDATYSVTRHIEVLCALMGEARLLREQRG
ncbi:DUF6477 family protein [Primorskyibacter sp. 2E107]|uniref:DUF6477 family protein n=1 Tax=Primorskyibacter sp. 2E107 TaxID=3403458 RepID=UPI003AF57E84